jgi:hypothetical protein
MGDQEPVIKHLPRYTPADAYTGASRQASERARGALPSKELHSGIEDIRSTGLDVQAGRGCGAHTKT